VTVGILAHGFGGRVDLPVPRELFVLGAGTALIVSFLALAALWQAPRLEGGAPARRLGRPRILSGPGVEWTVRVASILLLFVVIAASFRPLEPTDTIAPVLVFDWFWVGLAFASALVGNVWSTLSPWDSLGLLLQLDPPVYRPPLAYPKALGRWPAALLLFGFVWLELAEPFQGNPRWLGAFVVAYTFVTLGGMALFGRRAWIENGEAFAVYFGLFARLSPLGRDEEGRFVLRPPLAGLAALEPRPGQLALIVVALGSTSFDGFTRTSTWLRWTLDTSPPAHVLTSTAGLLAAIAAVAGAYHVAMSVAGRVVNRRAHVLAVRFSHSLVPIAFAYVVAHYFSFLLIEGQIGLNRLSDPLGFGWNLFGTATWTVDASLLSAALVWYVQVLAIVIGHVGGVVLAHDRAVALFEPAIAVRTQYALLAVMVLLSAAGLLVLSGG
jgi:hypothetical protein